MSEEPSTDEAVVDLRDVLEDAMESDAFIAFLERMEKARLKACLDYMLKEIAENGIDREVVRILLDLAQANSDFIRAKAAEYEGEEE